MAFAVFDANAAKDASYFAANVATNRRPC